MNFRSWKAAATRLVETLQDYRRDCAWTTLPTRGFTFKNYTSRSQSKQYTVRCRNEPENIRFWNGKNIWNWSKWRSNKQDCWDIVSFKNKGNLSKSEIYYKLFGIRRRLSPFFIANRVFLVCCCIVVTCHRSMQCTDNTLLDQMFSASALWFWRSYVEKRIARYQSDGAEDLLSYVSLHSYYESKVKQRAYVR